MENKPKLQPLRLADWAHNSDFFAKDLALSEKKPTRTVRLEPIPPSQLNLNFQVLKSSVGQTPVRSATSIKKKSWNSSVKVVNKERRVTEIKPHIRKTLNFTSQLKATDTRRNVADKKTPLLQNLAMSKEEKEIIDSTKEFKIIGIERIPDTPQNTSQPKNLQIMTPKSNLKMKHMNDSPLLTPCPKSCDSDETFLCIEKELEDNIVKGNEKDINIALPTSTTQEEKTGNNIGNKSCNQFVNENKFITKSPSLKIKKKIVFHNNKSTHLSPNVEKKDARNIYMGLKKNLKFLDTPKTNRTRTNEIDTPARIKKNLQSQINKLYNDDEF